MIENWINAATILFTNDDPLRALKLLELLPADMRAKKPQEIQELQRKIKAALVPARAYADYGADSVVDDPEKAKQIFNYFARARMTSELVRTLNKAGLEPHILELGPGTYWLPIGLNALGLKFKYTAKGVNQATKMQFFGSLPEGTNPDKYKEGPAMFVAFELIEHLEDPNVLSWEAFNFFGKEPDALLISTPNGCFDNKNPKVHAFEPGAQQHLRTYLELELLSQIQQSFGTHYQNYLFVDQILNLLAVNQNSPYTETIRNTFSAKES